MEIGQEYEEGLYAEDAYYDPFSRLWKRDIDSLVRIRFQPGKKKRGGVIEPGKWEAYSAIAYPHPTHRQIKEITPKLWHRLRRIPEGIPFRLNYCSKCDKAIRWPDKVYRIAVRRATQMPKSPLPSELLQEVLEIFGGRIEHSKKDMSLPPFPLEKIVIACENCFPAEKYGDCSYCGWCHVKDKEGNFSCWYK